MPNVRGMIEDRIRKSVGMMAKYDVVNDMLSKPQRTAAQALVGIRYHDPIANELEAECDVMIAKSSSYGVFPNDDSFYISNDDVVRDIRNSSLAWPIGEDELYWERSNIAQRRMGKTYIMENSFIDNESEISFSVKPVLKYIDVSRCDYSKLESSMAYAMFGSIVYRYEVYNPLKSYSLKRVVDELSKNNHYDDDLFPNHLLIRESKIKILLRNMLGPKWYKHHEPFWKREQRLKSRKK